MVESSAVSEVEERFNLIVEEYGRFLRNTIAQLCPKDLGIQFNDIEQEARMRLWRALESEREIHNLPSYLYRIAVTTTIDAVRRVKTKREEQLRLADEEDNAEEALMTLATNPETSPDRLAERRQIIGKVQKVLAGLPEDRRRAVGLYLEGMTSQEIADLTGWSEPRARNLTYRGLKDLRQQLRAEGIEYEID